MLFSALTVFFRDIEFLLGVILQAWFFLTPIVYAVLEGVPEHFVRFFPPQPDASLRQRLPGTPSYNGQVPAALLVSSSAGLIGVGHPRGVLLGLQPHEGPRGGGVVSGRRNHRRPGAKKRYRIYRRHETTLKSTIIRGRRGVYDEFAGARRRGRSRPARVRPSGSSAATAQASRPCSSCSPASSSPTPAPSRSTAAYPRCSRSAPDSTPSTRRSRTST